jgi:hypothetical protein
MIARTLLALGLVVVAAAAFIAWSTFGAWPVPDGYSFPRHGMWGGPDALFEGTLEEADGCIRATAGDRSFAVVWPPFYRLSVDDGEPVVRQPFRGVAMGEPVRMGGGYDEDGDPPPGSRDIGDCEPPFFLSTGFSD